MADHVGPPAWSARRQIAGWNRDDLDVVLVDLGADLEIVGRDNDLHAGLAAAGSRLHSPVHVHAGKQAQRHRQNSDHQQTRTVHTAPLTGKMTVFASGGDTASTFVARYSYAASRYENFETTESNWQRWKTQCWRWTRSVARCPPLSPGSQPALPRTRQCPDLLPQSTICARNSS